MKEKKPRAFAKIKIQGPFTNQAEYKQKWCKENREINGPDGKRIPGYTEYVKKYNKKYKQENRAKRNKYVKEKRDELKIEILSHYSDGRLRCARCGFNDIRALDLDHINNGGGKHRKVKKGGTYEIYLELKRNNFPEGYQVLCRNCNWIKEIERMANAQRGANTKQLEAKI